MVLTTCRVFGRVIHGLEHVLAIGKLPTDDRDRPLSPVTIPHCGELELRKPPPKKRSPSPSPRRSASPRRPDSSDSESDDSRRRKEKSRRREKKESRSKNKKPRGPREETLDELDARLEREEKERLEAERLERVEEQKREIERERIRAKESGDVVYKGKPLRRQASVTWVMLIAYRSRGNAIFGPRVATGEEDTTEL
jgi:peptidyl-prolyl isomerase G (cyclophilin G)